MLCHLFLQKWTSMSKWANETMGMHYMFVRLWADFWGIKDKCAEITSSESKRRNDVYTKQKCTKCAINMFSFGDFTADLPILGQISV